MPQGGFSVARRCKGGYQAIVTIAARLGLSLLLTAQLFSSADVQAKSSVSYVDELVQLAADLK